MTDLPALRSALLHLRLQRVPIPQDLLANLKDLGISSVSADYSGMLMEALHNYADGSMGMVEARNDFIQSMANSFMDAFDAGIADGGGDPDNVAQAASIWLGDRQDQERQNILDLFRTLKEQMAIDPPVDIGSWISDRSGGYTSTLGDVYSMGKLYGAKNKLLTFGGDDGMESCESCQGLKGTTLPALEVIARDLFPYQGNTNFVCGGWHCEHGWFDSDGNQFTQ